MPCSVVGCDGPEYESLHKYFHSKSESSAPQDSVLAADLFLASRAGQKQTGKVR
jgi:hypothetical protein